MSRRNHYIVVTFYVVPSVKPGRAHQALHVLPMTLICPRSSSWVLTPIPLKRPNILFSNSDSVTPCRGFDVEFTRARARRCGGYRTRAGPHEQSNSLSNFVRVSRIDIYALAHSQASIRCVYPNARPRKRANIVVIKSACGHCCARYSTGLTGEDFFSPPVPNDRYILPASSRFSPVERPWCNSPAKNRMALYVSSFDPHPCRYIPGSAEAVASLSAPSPSATPRRRVKVGYILMPISSCTNQGD